MDCTITVCCPICGKECTYKVSEWVRDHFKVVGVDCPCLEPPVVETKTHTVIVPQKPEGQNYKVLRKYHKGERS